MKKINILSLIQAHKSLPREIYNNFKKYHGIDIKDKEVEDLRCLVEKLYETTENRDIFDNFYLGYKIPQISKEFDLLRITNSCAINIELKLKSTEEQVQRQLHKNNFYLSHIGIKVLLFTYITEENALYALYENDKIKKVEFSYLEAHLKDQNDQNFSEIESLFDPSSYLVSPFNSTKKFMNNEYFLTNHQEELKNNILNTIKVSTGTEFISVTGSAGTGKTLLVYDIAKVTIESSKKTLLIHCGNLNNGQDKLKTDYSWNIIPIKSINSIYLLAYDVIIIDEAQRIRLDQLQEIVKKAKVHKFKCIFSYDKNQTLANWEQSNAVEEYIKNLPCIKNYGLTDKIRTNKEIASFIKTLFNNRKNLEIKSKDNIYINYFDNNDDAKSLLECLRENKWEIIRFTPSQYNKEHHEIYFESFCKSSHGVIGQEFDKVAIVIDKFFSYNEDGSLYYKSETYYNAVKMLFQNITRTRKKLNIVIISNKCVLDRCLSVLKN
ncbi:Uncharacterized conserved protein [Geoalkalibacter ferrihydriticus]|uniref:Schlafen group 3-like DNA/RNA helicase domain-containing protein n=2 Tax=Geoalkalibacter ferrihydriticus TaxID=392333 RepID=A0A0C2HIB7_9BACT|nr:DNA/RNA helicase domain-containing protein [Geoalkalibacter ferrihydriticus]KIH76736.1 hypothetical protein GFER_06250 [Geoalkalibacter ferrihydriticus DSM 17813]SDL54549.1 Uncharacterized conserved protein [Geoalkalibacter ferrihydriticus]